MADPKRNLYESGKVYSINIENICYVGLQIHGHTYGHQPEAVVWWYIIDSGYDSVHTYYWLINVSDEHKAIYMINYQHLESVSS